MANNAFSVPKLTDNGAWLDWRFEYPGGLGWRGDRALSNIRYAANHHSVTNPSGNARNDVNTLWNIHKANGWGGIGYNFVITSEVVRGKDGLDYAKVAYVGDIGSVRAHTTNARGIKGLAAGYGNDYIVAACMIGQLHIANPSAAQIRSAYWLYRELIDQEPQRLPNLRGSLADKLTAHKTWDYTECSGNWDWQRNQILNYKDPVAPAPVVPKWVPMDNPRKMLAAKDLYVRDLDKNANVGDVIKSGTPIEFTTKKEVGGKLYLRSKSSTDGNRNWGILFDDLKELPVAPVVTTKDITITKTIEFKKISVEDPSLEKGKVVVDQAGQDGVLTQVWTATYTDNVETDRKIKSEVVTKPAVDEITRVGTLAVADLEKRVSALEATVQAIVKFLSDLFKNFKIGK